MQSQSDPRDAVRAHQLVVDSRGRPCGGTLADQRLDRHRLRCARLVRRLVHAPATVVRPDGRT